MRIAKKDLKNFPRFMNHDTAREFFRGIYGERFCMQEITTEPDGSKTFHYSLVQDKERYLEWRDKLMNLEPVNDEWYRDSYQHCKITEKGKFTVYFDHPMSSVKEG